MRPDRLTVPANPPHTSIQARRTIGDARPNSARFFARVSVNQRARPITLRNVTKPLLF